MEHLFQQVIGLLNDTNYRFDVAQQHWMIRLPVEGLTGRFVSYLRILDLGQLVMYSKHEAEVPISQRLNMAEFITRVNFGIVVGNFEMDFSDGEIRFKTSIDSQGEIVTNNVLTSLINANLANMELYLPGIQVMMTGDVSPEEALELCQQQIEEETVSD
jgi:hypothetical protein